MLHPHEISHPSLDDFFVVTAISNTARYKRRYTLYKHFEKMCREAQVNLITVELAFGERPHEVTERGNPLHLQLRSHEEFWHKENLLNLGIAHGMRTLRGQKYVAWIDADCAPIGRTPRDWFEETWHELQHYEFVQMWEFLQPLDHDYQPLGTPNPSFLGNYVKYGTPYPKSEKGYPQQWGSPGLAWAANISALNHIGGIPDAAILGAGDWYLAHMLISDLPFADFKTGGYSKDYMEYWQHRQQLCEKWIKRDVGFVKAFLSHFYHGKIVNRGYNTREHILIQGQYSPHRDLKRDHHGLYQLETWEPRQIRMRDRIRQYFRARNEDDISL